MQDTRFTVSALGTLRLAQQSAAVLGHSYVGSEHLLLGLAQQPQTPAGRALNSRGLSATALQQTIASQLGTGRPGTPPLSGADSPLPTDHRIRGDGVRADGGKIH